MRPATNELDPTQWRQLRGGGDRASLPITQESMGANYYFAPVPNVPATSSKFITVVKCFKITSGTTTRARRLIVVIIVHI